MNGTERKYAELLELRKMAGEILDYKFDSLKLRLADKTFYTVDFFVTTAQGFECHEVKGFLRDDANVKFKVAAERYPYFRWTMVRLHGRGFDTLKEL
jgi:hypothetical protein